MTDTTTTYTATTEPSSQLGCVRCGAHSRDGGTFYVPDGSYFVGALCADCYAANRTPEGRRIPWENYPETASHEAGVVSDGDSHTVQCPTCGPGLESWSYSVALEAAIQHRKAMGREMVIRVDATTSTVTGFASCLCDSNPATFAVEADVDATGRVVNLHRATGARVGMTAAEALERQPESRAHATGLQEHLSGREVIAAS